MEAVFLLVYFTLAVGCFFAVLAERNRKDQDRLDLANSSEALGSTSRGGETEAGAQA
jgi:hypothetical protein